MRSTPELSAAARACLNRDPLHHADMLCLIDRPETELLYAAEDGVLLLFSGWLYALSASDAAAERLLPRLAGWEDVILHQKYLLPKLLLEAPDALAHAYRNVAYCKTTPVDFTAPDGVEIRLLDQSFAKEVHAHYDTIPSLPYIEERIEAGMFGAFMDGRLAGFIGTHTEGTMGILVVLPEYRRHGLAYALEAALINDRLSRGILPFGQVAPDNAASLALQRRIGMTVCEQDLYWVSR